MDEKPLLGTPIKKEYLINNFTLVRLFASLRVILANHYIGHFELLVSQPVKTFFSFFGGVPLFFFLAGIFIPMTFCRKPNILPFLRNRFLRIFPVMWISILLAIVLMFISGFYPKAGVESFTTWLVPYLIYPLYTPEWLRDYGVGTLNGSLWMIPAMVTFYLFVPIFFLYLKLGNRPSSWTVGVFLVFLMFQLFVELVLPMATDSVAVQKMFKTSFFSHFPMFIYGMFVYEKFDFFYNLVKGRFFIFLGIYLCVAYTCNAIDPEATPAAHNPSILRFPMMLFLGLLALSAGYSMPTLADKILRRKDFSYGMYVYHMPIANYVIQVFGVGLIQAICSFFATCVAAFFSYTYIESKFLKMKKNSMRNINGSESNGDK